MKLSDLQAGFSGDIHELFAAKTTSFVGYQLGKSLILLSLRADDPPFSLRSPFVPTAPFPRDPTEASLSSFSASRQGCRKKGAPARGSKPLPGYINSAGGTVLSSWRPPTKLERDRQAGGSGVDDTIRSTKTVSKSFPSPFLCARGTSVRGTGMIPLSSHSEAFRVCGTVRRRGADVSGWRRLRRSDDSLWAPV